MNNLKWYEPYKPRLPKIITRIRRRYWSVFIPTLILLALTYYPFNYNFYRDLLTNHSPTSLQIGVIYAFFALQRLVLVLLLGQVFAYLLLTHDLRFTMKRRTMTMLGVLLLIAAAPYFVLYVPIGFAMKKIRERRIVRHLITRKMRKVTLCEPLIFEDPALAHEHFVNAHMYLRGDNNHDKDINAAIFEFGKAVNYGHYLASYRLAKIYAGFDKDYGIKPNYVLAEKYLLNCLLNHSLQDDELARLYYFYGLLSEKVLVAKGLNEHDIYLIRHDVYSKAELLGHPKASEKLAELHRDYRYFNTKDVENALKSEPFTFLLNGYEDDLHKVKRVFVETPLERLAK